MFLEDNQSVLDAIRMTVTTITIIELGEKHDLSPFGRIFTIILIFAGLGLAAVLVAQRHKSLYSRNSRIGHHCPLHQCNYCFN
ncbi:potassium channel family protein [Maridesulfovibrio sp. FT414]|uniref:potassium channel family protein n=1 Tax=Maridesulfovibrio sp. FT414 TaxID=2979469 RepID=UPI003D804145